VSSGCQINVKQRQKTEAVKLGLRRIKSGNYNALYDVSSEFE
jgi:hypothetical protein